MFLRDRWFKKCFAVSLIALCLTGAPHPSMAKLLVVGTTGHEALLAKEVGGDFIDIGWIVGAGEDPHVAEPGKAFDSLLNKADLLLVNGQDLEAGWLGSLLKDTRNEKITRNNEHIINLSEDAAIVPYSAEELQKNRLYSPILGSGLGKTAGNHHYWLDPANEIPMIQNIKKALIHFDPENSKAYETNAQELIKRLKEKIREWDAKMAPFKGKKIISYHRDWTYLANRHGLEIVAYIEPGEMTRPAYADFKAMTSRFKGKGVSAILLSETQRPPAVNIDDVRDLGVRLHAKTLILPDSMSANEKRADIIGYFDYVYEKLIAVLQ